MVNVGSKRVTKRKAAAEGILAVSNPVMEQLRAGRGPKGDPFAAARIAAIQAAKKTSDLIPMCHRIALTGISVHFAVLEETSEVLVRTEVEAAAQTGVEMEALVAAGIALLTLYDMLKSADKAMCIKELRLVAKSGGQSGRFSASSRMSRSELKQ